MHDKSKESMTCKGLPSIATVYLRKGSIIVGMTTFQLAYIEIDVVVGLTV